MKKNSNYYAKTCFIELINALHKKTTEFDAGPLLQYNIAARAKALAYVPYNRTAHLSELALGITINQLDFKYLSKEQIEVLIKNKFLSQSIIKNHYQFTKKGGRIYLLAESDVFGINLSFEQAIDVPSYNVPIDDTIEPINYLIIDPNDRQEAHKAGALWDARSNLFYFFGQPSDALKTLNLNGIKTLEKRLDDDTPVYYVNIHPYKYPRNNPSTYKRLKALGLHYDFYQQRWYVKAIHTDLTTYYRLNPLMNTPVATTNHDPNYLKTLMPPVLPNGIDVIKTRKPSTVSLIAYFELKQAQERQQATKPVTEYNLGRVVHKTDQALLYHLFPNGSEKKIDLWIPKAKINKDNKINYLFLRLKVLELLSSINHSIDYLVLNGGDEIIDLKKLL